MTHMEYTPLAAIDSSFKDLGGPGAQPFQLDAGMKANGLEVTQAAPPQASAPKAEPQQNTFAGLVGGTKPQTLGR